MQRGRFSDYLLTHWHGQKLISIDPWREADSADYDVAQAVHDDYYELTKKLLARHGERSEIWRTTSVEAAKRVPDRELDFVYIDAQHYYAPVLGGHRGMVPEGTAAAASSPGTTTSTECTWTSTSRSSARWTSSSAHGRSRSTRATTGRTR